MFYKFSIKLYMNVRGFIRNVTKTRERLGSVACGTSEGTFVGNVSDPSTFIAPMDGAHSLFNATEVPLVYPHVTDLRRPSIPVMFFPSTWVSTGDTNQLTALAAADIMSSELTCVIVKPSGLTMAVGVQ